MHIISFSVPSFTTPVRTKQLLCITHKVGCFIQTQVVKLKVLMIVTSAVTESRIQYENGWFRLMPSVKSGALPLYLANFHYVHLTTCVWIEIIDFKDTIDFPSLKCIFAMFVSESALGK